jgi:hypothetical protein
MMAVIPVGLEPMTFGGGLGSPVYGYTTGVDFLAKNFEF